MNKALIVFLKTPIVGCVKTRLAKEFGHHVAVEIYRLCVRLTLKRLSHLSDMTTIFVDSAEGLRQVRDWLGSGWNYSVQQGSDLGQRLTDASQSIFKKGSEKVVIIGTDSPWINAGDIEKAFEKLNDTEIVLGPTSDGGYYLVGLSKPIDSIFKNISWSSSSVFDQTLTKIRMSGLSVSILPLGYDIDYPSDLEKLFSDRRLKDEVTSFDKIIKENGGVNA